MVQDPSVQRYINQGVKQIRRDNEDIILHLPSDTSINGNNFFTMKWNQKSGKWVGEHTYTTWESMYPTESHGPFSCQLNVFDERFILEAYGIKERVNHQGSILKTSPSQLEEMSSKR